MKKLISTVCFLTLFGCKIDTGIPEVGEAFAAIAITFDLKTQNIKNLYTVSAPRGEQANLRLYVKDSQHLQSQGQRSVLEDDLQAVGEEVGGLSLYLNERMEISRTVDFSRNGFLTAVQELIADEYKVSSEVTCKIVDELDGYRKEMDRYVDLAGLDFLYDKHGKLDQGSMGLTTYTYFLECHSDQELVGLLELIMVDVEER